MKKAEMEIHAQAYASQMRSADDAEKRGLYKVAVKAAMDAWGYIDGMLQYSKRYEEKEFRSVSAIDFVLHYAPLLLDRTSLKAVDGFLETCRRIHRQTSEDIPELLADAENRLIANHGLWSLLETTGEVRQDTLCEKLGGGQDYWRNVAQAWEKMGLISRTPDGESYLLRLSTRMGEIISGKCPACGHVDQAPKGMFLEVLTCPKCRRQVFYVLLGRVAT